MADFVKLEGYNVKDALAGKSLSISGDQLSLLKADGTAASTVTIPDGTIYTAEVKYTDTNITGQVDDPLAAVKLGTGTWSITITPTLPAGKTLFDVNRVFTGVISFPNAMSGYQNSLLYNTCTNMNYVIFGLENDKITHSIGGFVSLYIYADGTILEWGWTTLSSGGGSANTNIAFIAQSSGWPTLNTLYYLAGTFKLTNQIGIKSTGWGSGGPYETSILATGILIDDTYASAEDYLASSPSQGNPLKIVAWFVVNANTIAKVTATGTYSGNGEYTISSVSATTATAVGV